MDLINQIHTKVFKEPMELKLSDLQEPEKRMEFTNLLKKMDIAEPNLIEFMQDQSLEELINKQI